MRKLKPQLQRIDIEELFNNSSNRGMLSFLERPPQEAQERLREKQKVNQFYSQPIDSAYDTYPEGELPPVRDLPRNLLAVNSLPSSQTIDDSQVLSDIAMQLPLGVSHPQGKSHQEAFHLVNISVEETPFDDTFSQDTLVSVKRITHQQQGISQTGQTIAPTEKRLSEPLTVISAPERKLPHGVEPVLDGAVIGRRQKIRKAIVAQDGHSSGEQLLYQSLWNAALAETPETRLLSIGYNGMSSLCKLDRSNCKKNIQSLIEKLSVQIAKSYESASSIGTTYRIFSYKEILRRRTAAGLVWVVRTSGVRFVHPEGKLPTPPGGASPSPSLGASPRDRVGKAPTPPVCETPTQLGISRTLEGITSSSTVIFAALSRYGKTDDDALARLIHNCKEQALDCTEEEIVHFIHEKGSLVRRRDTRIQNPIGFLIDAVPKCFSGEAFRFYRQIQNQIPAVDDFNEEHRDRQWGREHEADLLDPTTPEAVKEVIRKCLGRWGSLDAFPVKPSE